MKLDLLLVQPRQLFPASGDLLSQRRPVLPALVNLLLGLPDTFFIALQNGFLLFPVARQLRRQATQVRASLQGRVSLTVQAVQGVLFRADLFCQSAGSGKKLRLPRQGRFRLCPQVRSNGLLHRDRLCSLGGFLGVLLHMVRQACQFTL